MQYPFGRTANEPADTTVVITAHHQHVGVMVVHEQGQRLGRVTDAHMTVLDRYAVTLGQRLEGIALGFMKCVRQVGVEQEGVFPTTVGVQVHRAQVVGIEQLDLRIALQGQFQRLADDLVIETLDLILWPGQVHRRQDGAGPCSADLTLVN